MRFFRTAMTACTLTSLHEGIDYADLLALTTWPGKCTYCNVVHLGVSNEWGLVGIGGALKAHMISTTRIVKNDSFMPSPNAAGPTVPAPNLNNMTK